MALATFQFATAEKQAAAALKLDPASQDAQMVSGLVALYLKDYAQAAALFQKVVEKSPSNFLAINNLALALAHQGEADKKRALEYAQMNAQRAPSQPEAWATVGWVLYRLGRAAEAEAAFHKALELGQGQTSANLAYYIARISTDRKRYDEAHKCARPGAPLAAALYRAAGRRAIGQGAGQACASRRRRPRPAPPHRRPQNPPLPPGEGRGEGELGKTRWLAALPPAIVVGYDW